MNAAPKSPKDEVAGTVVVAVGFDDQTDALIATAVSLARRFNLELRFIHAVLSPAEVAALDYSTALYAPPVAYPVTNDELTRAAWVNLEEVMAKVPADIKKTSAVLTGHPVPIIAAEAVARRASLIVCACDPGGYNAFSEAMSATAGLMHDASVPVLVVSKECPVDFTKTAIKILLADDLQASTEEATRKAYELASKLGKGASVRHVHVHGDFREMLRDSWRDTIVEAKALLPGKHEDAFEAALEREYEGRKDRLGGQGQPWRSAAEAAGAQVTLDIRTGSVAKELHESIADGSPDLVVFGRHRLFRAKPFLIGRMPFRAMLQEKKAVLLVPPAGELYARLPFPGA